MKTYTIWVCADCMAHEANGECSACEGEMYAPHDREPLSLLDDQDATLGLMAEAHHEDCDYRNSRAAAEMHERMDEPWEIFDCNLDCENDTFSTSRCEGCGSTLAGSRHAMTIHEKD